jgi:hypothetical protein
MNSNQCQQVGPLPSAGARLVGLLPCCSTCAHVLISLEAYRPFSPPYPLTLSLLPHLAALHIRARPPPDRRPTWLGSPVLSRTYPRSRVRPRPTPPGQISRRGYGEPDLARQQATVGMHGAQRPRGGERATPDHLTAPLDGATLSPAPFPSLISPAPLFCSVLPLPPRRSAPCSHSHSRPRFCSGCRRSTGTTGSHHQISLGFERIFMWTYRWNRSL